MSGAAFSWSPLFSTIIDSSVWRESKETRLVWITLLAKKNRVGYVRAALWALARDAGVTEDECREAIRVLESPDAESHCKDYEGRRVKSVDGGWMVLNHMMYRDMISKANQRAKQAEWQKEYRKRRKHGLREAGCEGARSALAEGFAEAAGDGNGNGHVAVTPVVTAPPAPPPSPAPAAPPAAPPSGSSAVDKILMQNELKRVELKLTEVRAMAVHTATSKTYTQPQLLQLRQLKARRDELVKQLGFQA